ncbi:MAG TPA: pilus assembly protein N-terminal domain-containing protein [Thermoguttaceae bacterium]|nr:pilus assembly protein N-terminal domain-containing protein [Thermoguttaceae bacterium]
MFKQALRPFWPPVTVGILVVTAAFSVSVQAQQYPYVPPAAPAASARLAQVPFPRVAQAPQVSSQPGLSFKVERPSERLEMTVNTSRRLTTEGNIREAQVNNPDLLDLQPLAPNQIQVSAKTPGVTQIHLFGVDGTINTIDVIVYADAQELQAVLRAQFPNASLKILPVASGVIVSGYVDEPEDIDLIVRTAEEFYPKVINKMRVSGVQQVVLQVKVIEVSRTKLRALGFDFAKFTNGNAFISTAAGLITSAASGGVGTTGKETLGFSIFDGGNAFFGVLEALREDKLAKILSEPNIVAESGRPAFFHVGGEFGYEVAGGITGPAVEWKQFGTRVDFVPIVLGNGRVRLEVRAMVSERDDSNAVRGIPAVKTREVETGVELGAGQTLAIAGLVQSRTESQNRGLPWISEVPYLGAMFRRVENQTNEVELLILVTPELVEPMDTHEVPQCLPGQRTTEPGDWDLYWRGHLEVPNCGPAEMVEPNGQFFPGAGPYPAAIPDEGMMIDPTQEIPESEPDNSVRFTSPPSAPMFPRATAPPAAPSGQPAGLRSPPSRPLELPVDLNQGVSYNRYIPSARQVPPTTTRHEAQNPESGLIGPIGYDVVK